MAQETHYAFPFPSVVTWDSEGNIPSFDRAVDAIIYRELMSKMFTTGVAQHPTDSYQVSAGEGMSLIVRAGFAVVEGCLCLDQENRTLVVQQSDSRYGRIDSVVIRLNDLQESRTCDLYVVQGTPSANPTRPALTRTESVYEIALCDVLIPANATSISNNMITDTRYDPDRSGKLMANAEPYIDTVLSSTSMSPVTNSAITTKFNQIDTYNAQEQSRVNALIGTKADASNVNFKVQSFSADSGVLRLVSVSNSASPTS